jgi:sugar phosphate isomerase/epimerase
LKINKSISSIAWNQEETNLVLKILQKQGFEYIEVAPFDLVKDWDNIDYESLKLFRKKIEDCGMSACSVQSIFYGTNFNLFNNRKECLVHFKKVEEVCQILGCEYAVFGSPRARSFPEYYQEIDKTSFMSDFFDNVLENANITIGIEAIPKEYGSNFCCNYYQVNEFVKNKKLAIHLDTACANFVGLEKSISFIDKLKVRNIHLSNYNLRPLTGEENYLNTLQDCKMIQDKFISIEMRKTNLEQIKQSIEIFNIFNRGKTE